MARKISFLLVLSLVMVGLLAVTTTAKNRIVDERLEKLEHYKFLYKPAMADYHETAASGNRGAAPAGLDVNLGNSPGIQLGFSYYDAQQNSSMGRLVDWRATPQIHFGWMFGPSADVAGSRTVAYNVYDGTVGNFPLGAGVGCAIADPGTQRAGFVNLDVRPPDPGDPDEQASAVYGAHVSLSAVNQNFNTHVYWDQATSSFGFCDWSQSLRVPDAMDDTLTTEAAADVIWPKLEYQIIGSDTVTYACSFGSAANTPLDNIVVFRTEGRLGGGTWTPTIIDQTFFPLQDITASRASGKVAVAYLLPTAGTSADPESNERDVYYRESTDMGLTWGTKVNVTNYNDAVSGHRAWLEVSCLYTSDDNLHIIWNGSVFVPGEGAGSRSCRIFHWSDVNGIIGTVYNAEWSPLDADCVMGFNVMNVGKFTISECDDKLYVIWSQANDPDNGLIDDCADATLAPANVGGNAEIYLSVSEGLTGLGWDAPRNLTNTYTPGCDTTGGNECDSDNWASMSRYGMDNSALSFNASGAAGALTVDPSGSYAGTYYLDVQYVNDLFPSAAPYEGTPEIYTPNPLRWFRLPCVDPIVQSNISLSPSRIQYPTYLQHGVDSVVAVTIENSGNTAATGTISKVETSGPAGWLAFDLAAFNIPSALNNFDTVNVTLNNGGVVNNPGTVVNLVGWIICDVDQPTVRDSVSLEINFLIADTIVGAQFDTVATSCLQLVVSNTGNMGNAGADGNGGANMNFFADCDDADSIPGDASVYMYDGSPVIITADTIASWSIFDDGFATPNGFKPIESDPNPGSFTGADYDAFWSGPFVTIDTALTIEKTWYAPTTGDCNFIIQTMCIYSTDGSAQNNLAIGEAWDWDIPSDSAARNIAGSDPFTGVVWLQGSEWNEAVGDGLECQNNDARFGGAALIGYTDDANGTLNTGDPENFYTALNEDFVFPAGGFVPEELYENMQTNSGISVVPSSTIEDQHMVMTVFKSYDLAAGDTLVVHIVMATVENGTSTDLVQAITDGRAWFNAHPNLPKRPSGFVSCCTGFTGDVSNDGNRTLTDLTQLVNMLFVTFVDVACMPAANTSGDAGCALTLTDLTALVNKLFVTFVETAPCASFDNSLCN